MAGGVVGVGLVGAVTSGGLGAQGHDVGGIEVAAQRTEARLEGPMPFHGPGLDGMVAANRAARRLSFTADTAAVADAEVIFVAVGTHDGNGGWQTGTIQACLNEIVPRLADEAVLVIRSTLPPWFLARLAGIVGRMREEAGRGEVPVILNPEFTKAGTPVKDFLEPERIVLGLAHDVVARGADRLRRRCRGTDAPIL